MINKFLAGAATVAIAATLAAGCNKLGPQKQGGAAAPNKANKTELYQPDMSKPDGPMLQLLRGAQERDEALMRASFAPSFADAPANEEFFRRLRRKVLSGRVTPVPESVQQISDTEAIVKVRQGKGGEIPLRVGKFDGKWLITGVDAPPARRDKFLKKNQVPPDAVPPATPADPAAPKPAPGA